MIKDDLNKKQKEAVLHKEGPLLIVAGAGTGKTTVITQRIVYLIENEKVKPEEILAVTFTDKAAEELEERVDKLLSIGYVDLWISTFHSFCERILKDHALDIGLPADFKILDQTAAWILVRQNLDKFKLDYYRPLGNPTKFIHALISHFSRCKDQAIYPEDYLKYAESLKTNLTDLPEDKESERIKEVAEAYHVYQRLLLENNVLDFGDLINYCLQLFQKRPHILKKYRENFKYILVDEFQDTNWAQYELVKILASPKNNLTVCADDDQAIYRWRGASFNNIIQFKKDYLELKEVFLVQNYRSSQNILDLAYEFIKANNPNRLEHVSGISKKLVSSEKEKGIVEHLHFKSLEEETRGVINRIINTLNKDKEASFKDFVILVRTNEAANAFTRVLEMAEFPYQFLASRGLYSKPVILDIISYLKLLDNYHESSALYRILNLDFFHIPSEDVMKITQYSHKKAKSLYESLQELPLIPGISSKAADKITFLLDLIGKHTRLAAKKSVLEVLIAFLEDSGYLKYLSSQENNQKLDLIYQFCKKTKGFEESALDPTLKNFIEQINMELESGEQGKLEFDLEQGPDMIRIMTIHSAKGLEFKYVFLVNLVDKRFPTIEQKEPIEIPDNLIKEIIPEGDIHLQEERRLCYVAMTRAKRGLFLTSGEDYGGVRRKKLSRFLIEMGFNAAEFEKMSAKSELDLKKNTIKKRIEESALPPYFSFSQLAAFEKCPLQYKFAHILKIPIRGKAMFSFGKTMHNALYDFLKQVNEEKVIDQENLFGFKQEPKRDGGLDYNDLLGIYNKNWIDDWYESKNQKEEYYKLGKKVLKNFFEEFQKNKPEISYINNQLALELPFRLKIGGDVLIGRIDRVDKIDEGVRIVDYKTGKFKEKLSPEDRQQLIIYQIALEEVFDLEISELSYYFLEEGKLVSFSGTEKDKKAQKEKILFQIEKIKNSEFKATPGWQCSFCDFKDICEYAKI